MVAQVLGFFVLDQTICGLSSGAFPRIQTEQEWISQSSVIVAVLSEACSVASDSAALVQLRSLVCLFCASLDRYNLTTRAIRASLDGQLEHYISLLLEEGREDVLTALKNDKAEALRIDNAVDYARLVVDLNLHSYLHPIQSPMEKAGKEEMSSYERKRRGLLPEPVTMIFSRSVPRLIQISKNFVFDLASFLDLSSPNCVQVLVQALDDTRVVQALNYMRVERALDDTRAAELCAGASAGARSLCFRGDQGGDEQGAASGK